MFTKLFSLNAALAAAALGIAPTAALADHHGIHIDIDVRPQVEVVAPPPVAYEDREVRVWVDATYQSVQDRQWVAPVYQTVTDRTWVPAVVQNQDVIRWEHGRRVLVHEQVVIQPGHYQESTHQELVSDGHWQIVDRQQLVTPGHWETHIEHVAVSVAPPVVVEPSWHHRRW